MKAKVKENQKDLILALTRVNILGVGISAVNMRTAVHAIGEWIRRHEQHYICVTGVHGVMECQHDEALTRIHNASGLTVPDGMPMVWAGRMQGFTHMSRVYGPDLMLSVYEMFVSKGFSHFLYGGNMGVAGKLRNKLEEKFTGIRIVGTYTPPFRPLNPNEETELQEMVGRLKPDIFWVGLSTPKQERFMAEYIKKLDTTVMIGVGAAFDIHAGYVKDAPDVFKKTGMQWFYRLCKEPKRLWRRYLYNNPMFVYKFVKQMFTKRV